MNRLTIQISRKIKLIVMVFLYAQNMAIAQIPYAKHSHLIQINGHKFDDYYFWLSNKKDSVVLKALQDENQKFEDKFNPDNELKKEIKTSLFTYPTSNFSDVNQPDLFKYKNKEFKWINRNSSKKIALIKVNGDTIFNSKKHFSGVKFLDMHIKNSPNTRYIGILSDTTGGELFTFEIFDLDKEELLPITIKNITEYMEWGELGDKFYYVRPDSLTRRFKAIYSSDIHGLNEQLIYFESNLSTHVYPYKLENGKVLINAQGTNYFNQYFIDGDSVTQVLNDERGVYNEIKNKGNSYYLKSNFRNEYYSIYEITNSDKIVNQAPIIEGDLDFILDEFYLSSNFLILKINNGPSKKIQTMNLLDYSTFEYPSTCAVEDYSINLGAKDSNIIELTYYPATGPFEYHYLNLQTNSITKSLPAFKKKEVFDGQMLESKIIYAESSDGVQIPISLVYKKGCVLDGNNPVELEAYGAYGANSYASFTYLNWPFLNRGGIIAFAHIRGGGEYGDRWHQLTTHGNKEIAVNDLIACSERLVELKFTKKGGVFLFGGSAGGIVVARAFSKSPTLFGGMCLRVPFLDAITTMSDSLLPGVNTEYNEWGNPWNESEYTRMMKYDPYRNMPKNKYPPVILFSSFNDSRVMSWEAHKYTANYRENNTGKSKIFLKTYMNGGHFSRHVINEASVKYSYWLKLFSNE